MLKVKAVGVCGSEDKESITGMADSLKRHMIDSRTDNDFCNASFSRVLFVAFDNVRQSIHVVWALRITKNAYQDITVEEQAKRNIEAR